MSEFAIIGSEGRMGRAIRAALDEAGGSYAGGIDAGGDPAPLATRADVLIDFSHPAALEANLDAAVAAGKPILIGTTGLAERHHWLIDRAAESIAVLQTGTTSLGVTLLAALVEQAAARLGPEWDIEITETHHRMKRDAPSGTALLLGEAAAKGRGHALAPAAAHARDGITGPRIAGSIGFASLRGGLVAGDHTVHFLADHEHLTLAHHAENRSIFATGAIRAARWLINREAGRYGMRDVLEL